MNWRPISEAPKDGTAVDLWDGARFSDCHWSDDKERWQDVNHKRIYADPTHFMLVTPPGEQQQPESGNQRLLDAAEKARIELMWLIQQRKPREGGSVMRAYEELIAAIDAAKQAKQ